MPDAFIENGLAIHYNGVSIFHLYKDDYLGNGIRQNVFSTDEFGREGDENQFDVRGLPGYDNNRNWQWNIVNAIKGGLFDQLKLEESKPHHTHTGMCPVCNSSDLIYAAAVIEKDFIRRPYACGACDVSGVELGHIQFCGFEVAG